MNKFAMVDDDGNVPVVVEPSWEGMYSDGERYGNQTARAVPVEVDASEIIDHWYWANSQWNAKSARPSEYHTWSVSQGAWVFNFNAMRDASRVRIDAAAGDARSRYITIAPGQEATYAAKYEQAKAFLAATSPLLDNYPWIKLEAQATGMTPHDCAQRIKQLGDLWGNVLGPTIEAIRIAGKDALDVMQEPTFEQITDHVDQVIAALEAI